MILDYNTQVSKAQSLSGATTTVATDTLDLGGNVRIPEVRVSTYVSAVGGTTPTLVIELFGDTASGFGTEKSLGSRSIATADLVANKMYHLDAGPAAAYRYFRVKFTQAGTSPTATVDCWVGDHRITAVQMGLAGVNTP